MDWAPISSMTGAFRQTAARIRISSLTRPNRGVAKTLVAVPVFAAEGQIQWGTAAILALGFALGGAAGSKIAVAGGERVIRPVLALAVLALAGRMLGLY